MYEERRWGRYRVIDYVKYAEDNEVLTKRILVHAGKNISYQLHYKRSEVWTIVSGVADIVINDKLYQVKPGDVVRIPQMEPGTAFELSRMLNLSKSRADPN